MELNQTTREAQTQLVAGLEPVAPKVRFRRAYTHPKSAENLRDEYYDFRGTEAEARWLAAQEQIAANIADSGWPTEYDPEKKLRVVRVTDEGEYELEYDLEALRALGKQAEQRGIPNASSDEDEQAASAPASEPSPEEASPEGWSYGADLRVSKPINSGYPVNQRELRRIGRLNSGCTAVAVGRRLLLTAAHCVTNAGGTYTQQTYRARQSNTTIPYGTVQSVGVHIDIPEEWLSLNCHITRTTTCHQHDWAIIFLPSDVWEGQTHPGWMGYHAPPNWSFYQTNNELLENGYPNELSCYTTPPNVLTPAQSGVPAFLLADIPNRRNVAYGQNSKGRATDFMDYVGSYPRRVHFDMDISCGHSGGAVWSDYPGSNGPYVLGVNVYERCPGASCGDASGTTRTHPNGMRAMTPGLADLISDYRVLFP